MNKLSPSKIVKELKNNNLYILTSIIIIVMLCLVIIPFPFIFVNSSNKILSPIFEIFDPDSDEYIIITWEYNSRHGYYNYQYIFSDNEKNIDELESLELRESISQTNKAIIERNYGYLYFRVKSSISEYSNWINMYVEQKQLNKPNIHYLNGINSNIIIDPVTYYNYSTKRAEYVSTYSYYFSIEGQEYKPTLDFFIDNDNNLTLDISEYISRCLLNPNENDLIYNDVLDYKLTGIWDKDLVLKIYVNAVNYEINIGKTNIKGLSNVYINSDFDMKEFIITKEEFDLINQ